MTAGSPNYDLIGAIDALAPGTVVTRERLDGVAAAYAANGFQPLTQAQIVAVTGPPPPPLSSIPRSKEDG